MDANGNLLGVPTAMYYDGGTFGPTGTGRLVANRIRYGADDLEPADLPITAFQGAEAADADSPTSWASVGATFRGLQAQVVKSNSKLTSFGATYEYFIRRADGGDLSKPPFSRGGGC